MRYFFLLMTFVFLTAHTLSGQQDKAKDSLSVQYKGLKFRNIGPFRGGRSVASTGVIGDPMLYYMGSTGGGVWKTDDAGITWKNISDGFFKTGSVGAIAVADSDPNVIYVGMGEHPVRGVMTSHGDGVYKSTDAGATWTHVGLKNSRHISAIRIHPDNADVVYVAVQGAVHGDSEDRGIYGSSDGGQTWEKLLYVDFTTGASDLSMDRNNPRILYAAMWDHRRLPWQVRSGGPGSALYKSTDSGKTWEKLSKGLPSAMGKTAIDVSPANSNVVYANIEAAGKEGGVYRSDDAGKSWRQTSKDRVTVARAWYYIEIFADPKDEDVVYVLNAPMLKSIDGGKTFQNISNPHGDQHHMWINPDQPNNIILSNDGGACITFNGGDTWSSQQNQPTAQFYRVITDRRFPYHVYAGQQDNTSVITPSRTSSSGIGWRDWITGPGCESAFLAFDPDDPKDIFGTCIQGEITVMDLESQEQRNVMAYPIIGLGWTTSEQKYRFNWNPPVVASLQDPSVVYHAGNVVLKTVDGGYNWTAISPDLTRNDITKQSAGGVPYTNEGAGGEVYNTIAYLELSQHDPNVIWTGSDCGLIHVTRDGGANWTNVTPPGLGEVLINSIDVSPHDPASAYAVATNYKFNDFRPMVYHTKDYGRSWREIKKGLPCDSFVRVVREDEKVPGLLYAGTETGLFISYTFGQLWEPMQLNLPVCPVTDLTFQDNDLVVSTSGRAFWILDDLSSIQSAAHKYKNVQIIKPKATVRMLGGGGFRPGEAFGSNPENGVIIDYWLPAKEDSVELTLTIRDAQDNVIRIYSSKKDKDFKKYIGGPSADKLLTTEKGLNRFAWDMKRESIPGVEGVFKLGGYDGAMVPPGTYSLTLSSGSQNSSTSVEIVADPRIKAEIMDYENQYKALLSLEEAAIDVHKSVNDMRKVKGQLENFKNSFTTNDQAKDLLAFADSLANDIDKWEGNLIQKDQETFQDVINFPNRLNAEITNLMGVIGAPHPRLTKGMSDRLSELLSEWSAMKENRDKILKGGVDEFNDQFRSAGLQLIQYKIGVN